MNFYFNDFAFDLQEYEIVRKGEIVSNTKGLTNTEGRKPVLHLYPDAAVQVGDILKSSKGDKHQVTRVSKDSFEGAEFIVVHY